MTAIPPERAVMSSREQSRNVAGHLYMPTNERDNSVVHYVRAVDGRITEVERIAAGGRVRGRPIIALMGGDSWLRARTASSCPQTDGFFFSPTSVTIRCPAWV
jgi:hypothetical protein